MHMNPLARFVATITLIGSLLTPLSASALGFSFGGRITAITPCANGAIWITIVPAGPFQPFYIWTPGTITYSAGPPSHPGQEVLGVADIPYVCYIPPFIFLYGQRMQIVGTSPL